MLTDTQLKVVDYIRRHPDGVTEFQLLDFIEQQLSVFFTPLGESPSLFKKHFYLFHILYRFNTSNLACDDRLLISALEIKFVDSNQATTSIGPSDRLAQFYLDPENLSLSESEIRGMLTKFWEQYLAIEHKAAAIKKLSLENELELTFDKLKKRYSQLALQCHPDKGGDELEFIEIKKAYETLHKLIY